MERKFTGVLLLTIACGPGVVAVEVPDTDVTLEEPVQPSALTALGIEETVAGTYTDGLRTTRSVSAMVAACVRPMLEREPWLKGRMGFQMDVQTRWQSGIERTGDLSKLSAADCVAAGLSKGTVGRKAEGTIEWDLELKGTFAPPPLADTYVLKDEAVALDWSSPAATPPREASEELAGTREKLKRCAFGAVPMMEEELWVVMRVGRDGAATLSPDDDETEASTCIRRVLDRAKFPVSERDYALSIVLTPSAEAGSASTYAHPTADLHAGWVRGGPLREPEDGAEFGVIGLINRGAGGSATDSIWGDSIGESFGGGSVGLIRSGSSGGGVGQGIGLGTIGTIGPGGQATTGAGFGAGGPGQLVGPPRSNPPKVRMGKPMVSGRLPPEVIQRIVRQNFGRFRLCYEVALKKDPKAGGKVSVSFEITRAGEVAKVSHTSTFKEKAVGTCVARPFIGLSFPQPESGIVQVTFPIVFSAGEDAEPEPPPPPKTLGGKQIDALAIQDIEARLEERRMEFTLVPGAKDAVFVRNGGGVHSVFIGRNESAGSQTLGTCRESTADRAVFVRGPSCEPILRRLLD